MSPGAAEEGWCEKVKAKKMEKVESEKQISVDPISLTESAPLPPNMHPIKYPPKLMSCSLPSSASSSPCFDLAFTKHKKKHKIHEGRLVLPLARQHSVALGNLERLRESHLRRSKSCGEGRACQPSVDFDMWSPKSDRTETEVRVEVRHKEEKFKCGACLFLPGLGKAKTVRARKEVELQPQPQPQPHIEMISQRVSLEKFECGSWRSSAIINYEDDASATSNLFFDLPVELMRCSSVNDADSPVTTGFVFDNIKDHHRKGVLKSTSTCRKSQELHSLSNSSRHVRFSTSSPKTSPVSPTSPFSTSSPKTPPSPSCITPRLHKARDDFNAFLEAQSA